MAARGISFNKSEIISFCLKSLHGSLVTGSKTQSPLYDLQSPTLSTRPLQSPLSGLLPTTSLTHSTPATLALVFSWHSVLPDTIYSSSYCLYSLSLPVMRSAHRSGVLTAQLTAVSPVPSTVPGTQLAFTAWRALLLLTGTTPECLAQGSAARWVGNHHGLS